MHADICYMEATSPGHLKRTANVRSDNGSLIVSGEAQVSADVATSKRSHNVPHRTIALHGVDLHGTRVLDDHILYTPVGLWAILDLQ
jgi:hypothetical protein